MIKKFVISLVELKYIDYVQQVFLKKVLFQSRLPQLSALQDESTQNQNLKLHVIA